MPVTAKLSRRFYEQLGDEVANELVEWFNAVDSTYKADLRELNDLNWQRFSAELRGEVAGAKAVLRTEMAAMKAELQSDMAAMKADLMKWMFLFWAGTVVPLAALILAVASQIR